MFSVMGSVPHAFAAAAVPAGPVDAAPPELAEGPDELGEHATAARAIADRIAGTLASAFGRLMSPFPPRSRATFTLGGADPRAWPPMSHRAAGSVDLGTRVGASARSRGLAFPSGPAGAGADGDFADLDDDGRGCGIVPRGQRPKSNDVG